MATPASGSRVQWYYCIEDGSGDISATTPNFVPIRFNTSDLARETTQIDSNEINPDRQRTKSRPGTYSIAGSIEAELSYGSHDTLMAAAFQSSWVTAPTISASTISAANADNSFNDSGSGFVAAGFAVGDLITVSGFTGDVSNNQSDLRIESVTASKIIVSGGTALVDDAEGETVTIATYGDYLDVGSTVPTFALLRRNSDIGLDQLYRHCRVGNLSLALTVNAAALITMNLVGETVEEYTVPGGSTFSAATTSDMIVPTIGSMEDGATALTFLADYNVEFTNNMNPLFALFQRGAYGVENGIFQATGTMSGFLEDNALLTKFVNETATDHIVTLLDPAGNSYRVILPDVGYTQMSDPVSGQNALVVSYTFSAGFDGVTTARIERAAA